MSNLDPHRVGPSLGRPTYVVLGLVVIALLVAGFTLIDYKHYVWGIVAIVAAAGVIVGVSRARR